jgi:hypothetical protein
MLNLLKVTNGSIKKGLFASVFLAVLVLNFLPSDVAVIGAATARAQTPSLMDLELGGVFVDPTTGVTVGTGLPATNEIQKKSGSVFQKAWDLLTNPIGAVAKLLIGILVDTVFWGFGMAMLSMGSLLDASLALTINSDSYNSLQIIDVGWTISRDVANMFFIFILLYIAIQTILGLMSHQTKTLLRNIIIVAILINFSLFFTKVIIDATNILALAFYYKVQTTTAMGVQYGPAKAFHEGFKMQSVFGGVNNSNPAIGEELPFGKQLVVKLGAIILMGIIAYMFLVGAVMLIVRFVVLIFCMMFSPLAFLGMVLPKLGGVTSAWWKHLIENAMFAPIFCFLIYIDVQFVRLTDLAKSSSVGTDKWSAALSGDSSNWNIILNFFILTIIFIGTLYISRSVSGSTSSFTKKAVAGAGYGGGAVIGTAAFAGRRIIGGGSEMVKDSAWAQRLAAKGGMAGFAGRSIVSAANVGAKSSFDLRAAPGLGALSKAAGMNLGTAGGRGGARAERREKYEDVVNKAKELFPNNPDAQEKYITAHTITAGSVAKAAIGRATGEKTAISAYNQKPGQFAAKEDKKLADTKREIDHEKGVVDAKRKIDDHVKGLEGKNAAEQKAYLDTMTTGGKKFADELTEVIQKLNAKEAAELSENTLKNAYVQQNLNNTQLAAIHAKTQEFKDPTLIANMTKNVLDGGTESGKRYMRNQISLGTSNFRYDYQKELREEMASYDAAKKSSDVAAQAAAEGRIRTIVSRIDAKDVAGLDEEFHLHEGVAATYKNAHVAAIQSRQKDKGDFSESFIEKFHGSIGQHNSDTKAKETLARSLKNNQSGLFNETIARQRIDTITKAGGELENAKAVLAAATPNTQAWREADAKVKGLESENNAITKALQ